MKKSSLFNHPKVKVSCSWHLGACRAQPCSKPSKLFYWLVTIIACFYDHQMCGRLSQSFLLPQTSFDSPKNKKKYHLFMLSCFREIWNLRKIRFWFGSIKDEPDWMGQCFSVKMYFWKELLDNEWIKQATTSTLQGHTKHMYMQN